MTPKPATTKTPQPARAALKYLGTEERIASTPGGVEVRFTPGKTTHTEPAFAARLAQDAPDLFQLVDSAEVA